MKDFFLEEIRKRGGFSCHHAHFDKSYLINEENFERSQAFKTACDLVFHGKSQPSGYTEPLLHFNRLMKKSI